MRRFPVVITLVLAIGSGCENKPSQSDAAAPDSKPPDLSRITPSAVCDSYLKCLSAAVPEEFPAALQVYRSDGPCWVSTSASAMCETACREAHAKLAQQYPQKTECRGAPTADAAIPKPKDGTIYLDGALIKPSTGCVDESSEPNNSGATATTISGRGLIPNWEICYPGDVDQYAITLDATAKLVAKVKFMNANGNLDAALVNPQGAVIAASQGTTDVEQIAITAPTTGRYVLGVYGINGATNKYDLDFAIAK